MSGPAETTNQNALEVVAPTDLRGQYEFFVDAGNNSSYKVRVPENGVKSGQRFQAQIVSGPFSRGPHNIPFGRWRDGLCDCCSYGVAHPVVCLTCWCPPCSLGQVLTRMKLSWSGGVPSSGRAPTVKAFIVLFVMEVLYIVFQNVLSFIYRSGLSTEEESDGTKTTTSDNDWAQLASNVLIGLLFLFLVFVTFRLRRFLRNKYSIPERTCVGCEDFCCSFWCLWCTICQAHRHTADFKSYSAGCCCTLTESGLPVGAPEVV